MIPARYRFGPYVLDLANRELQLHGDTVPLPARVFECLSYLIEHRDRAVSRDELVQAVFGRADVSDAQLAQIVLRARRAVGDDGQEQRSIRTVPRYGFRWLDATSVDTATGSAEPTPVIGAPEPTAPEPDPEPAKPATAPASAPQQVVTPARPGRATRVRFATAAALIAAVLGGVAWFVQRDPARPAPPPAPAKRTAESRMILVLPTVVASPDEAPWARLGLMDFVVDRLHRAGLPVLSSETVLGVLRGQTGQDDTSGLRKATRAQWIVTSQAVRGIGGWDVTMTATDATGVKQHGQARHDDLLEAARLAADRLSPTLGGRLRPNRIAEPGLEERLQRARAAMLANELDTARTLLTDAPELQRSRPQLQYQLARVDFRAGEFQRGLGLLDQALNSDDARQDPQFNARLLNARGAMLIRLDRYTDAEHSYDRAIASVGNDRYPAELGVALSGRAVAYAMQLQYDRALSDLGQARVQLANMGDALAVARVDMNLGILEVERHRPAHALSYLEKATQDFQAMGARNELTMSRRVLINVQLQLLRSDLALEESERAWALRETVRDPAQYAELVLVRAEALMAVGRLREAGQLLTSAEAGRTAPLIYGYHNYLRAQLARRVGRPDQTVTLADAALSAWPSDRNKELRPWMVLLREQAALDADRTRPKDLQAPLGDSLPDRLTVATLQRARGEIAAADATYRAAVSQAEQVGVPQETAAAVDAYATWLLERGRQAEAGALIGRVALWAEHDFDLAVLQLRLARAMGQRDRWRTAYQQAVGLAGERTIPTELDPAAPSSEG